MDSCNGVTRRWHLCVSEVRLPGFERLLGAGYNSFGVHFTPYFESLKGVPILAFPVQERIVVYAGGGEKKESVAFFTGLALQYRARDCRRRFPVRPRCLQVELCA